MSITNLPFYEIECIALNNDGENAKVVGTQLTDKKEALKQAENLSNALSKALINTVTNKQIFVFLVTYEYDIVEKGYIRTSKLIEGE